MDVGFKISLWIGILSWAFPVAFLMRSRNESVFLWLIVCHLFSFASELTAQLLTHLNITPNYAINIYLIFAFIPIARFFWYAVSWSNLRVAFVFVTCACVLFALLNALFVQKLNPNYYSYTLQYVCIIGVCLIYYYKLLNELPVTNLLDEPLFIIVCGWFIIYAGKLVFNLIGQYIYHMVGDNMVVLWSIFNGVTIIGNLTVMFGAYFQYLKSKSVNRTIEEF